MTTEEKAKAHDKALERAKKMMASKRGVIVKKEALQTIFPELAESEDERIRKAIILGIKRCEDAGSIFGTVINNEGVNYHDVLSWLEKQKEQKSCGNVNVESEYDKGWRDGHKAGLKDAEWSAGDKAMLQGIIERGQSQVQLYDTALNPDQVSWLKSLPLNLKKKNEDVAKLCSNEWSDEDEKMRKLLIAIFEVNHQNDFFKANEINTTDMRGVHTEEIISWLKSLRPQSKQE